MITLMPTTVMLSQLVILFVSLVFYQTEIVRCSIASPHEFVELQPDGTETSALLMKGGPKDHRLADTKGYTVIEDEDSGSIVYAQRDVETGRLVSSGLIVGKDDPEESSLEVDIEPDERAKALGCQKLCKEDDDNAFSVFGLTIHGADNTRRLGSRSLLRGTNITDNVDSDDPDDGWEFDFEGEISNEEYYQIENRSLQDRRNQKMASGTLRNLVILMKFSDHKDRDLPTITDFDIVMNKLGGDQKLAPSGSVRDVYKVSSYGKFDLLSTVIGWVNLPKPEAYYADGQSGTTTKFDEAMKYSLDRIDNVPSLLLSDYDKDNDFVIDNVMFVHSGYAAEWGQTDCHSTKAKNRIWSHKFNLNPPWKSKSTNFKAKNYFTTSALYGTCGSEIARIGTIAHETGHVLGLPDLYMGGNGIGSFGLMGNSWGFDGSQRFPPIMSAWSKIKIDWLENPTKITKSGRYTLKNIYDNPEAMIIEAGFPQNEYLLIENRQKIGFDSVLPESGLLIFHIDEKASFYKNPGWHGQKGWPENGNHYRVAVLQQDGLFELENGKNRGDEHDIWNSASSNSELGPGDLKAGGLPHPNTNAYQNGKIKETGIRIYDVQEDGHDVTFSVEIPGTTPSTENSVTSTPIVRAESEIGTTFLGGTGSYGNMFDVIAGKETIVVFSLNIHCRLTPGDAPSGIPVTIYTKTGTHEGFETNENEWTLISSSIVVPQGNNKRTVIEEEEFAPVTIPAGNRQAFYVTLDTPDIRYTRGKIFGSVAASNSDVTILQGTGTASTRFGKSYKPRVFNGILKYSVISNKPVEVDEGSPKVKKEFELATTFLGRNGSFGSMFNVLAQSTITVTSMDISVRTDRVIDIEVYTKKGQYQGSETDPSSWDKIFSGPMKGLGNFKPSPIPSYAFSHVQIEAEAVQAFFVVSTENILRYSTGGQTVADEHIQIFDGAGITVYPFPLITKQIYSPRMWNGSLKYTAMVNVLSKVSENANKELVSTFAGGNGSYGVMWTVNAKRNLKIIGMDFHTSAEESVDIYLYAKEGSHIGYDKDISSWNEICKSSVKGNGNFARTRIPDGCFDPIGLKADETISFYLTLSSLELRYTPEPEIAGEVTSQNDDLDMLVGSGVGEFPLSSSTPIFNGRTFNGVLRYQVPEVENKFLATTFDGGNGSFGNIVTLLAKRDLSITSLDIHLKSLAFTHVEVYTREGLSDGFEKSMNGWIQIYDDEVQGKGSKVKTQLDTEKFQTVQITKGEYRSFYITSKTPFLRYTNGDAFGQIYTSDDSLVIIQGSGVGKYLLNKTTPIFKPRIFNGNFYYE